MITRATLRKDYRKRSDEVPIIKFPKTKTYIFNDNYTLDLEIQLIGLYKRIDNLSNKIDEVKI